MKTQSRLYGSLLTGGGLILVCLMLLSSVSSFAVFSAGFDGSPQPVRVSLALLGVLVMQGAFIWLVYGFTRAFAAMVERVIALAGILSMVQAMAVNVVTHFMIVKHARLWEFQQAWLSWGAVAVFVEVLIFVVLIVAVEPVMQGVRALLIRLK